MKTLLIVLAVAICGCIYHAQWRHQAWLEKREADHAQRMELMSVVKEKNAVDAQRLQRQLDAIKRISDQRVFEIQQAQKQDEFEREQAEKWKTLLPK